MEQLSRLIQKTLLSVQRSVGLACVVAFQNQVSSQCKGHSFPKNVKKGKRHNFFIRQNVTLEDGMSIEEGMSKVFIISHTW